MPALSRSEAEVIEEGAAWLENNESVLTDLLESIVARPSMSGDEGRHNDSSTTVGYLWNFLENHTDDVDLEYQAIRDSSQEDVSRDNVYSVLEGTGEAALIGLSHTDIVPPGAHSAWPDDDPFSVSHGTATRIDRRTIEVEVAGETHERRIRDNLATVWDQRGIDEIEVMIGRGVYDNKVCSVCLVGCLLGLQAALTSKDAALGGDLIHAHLVDEEVEQLGVKAMSGWKDHDSWLADRYDSFEDFAAVILEGQYGFVPVVGHRGGINLTINAYGEAVHGSTPSLGRNAVLGTAKGLARMDKPEFYDAVTELFIEDELLGEFTVAPGTTIAGGGIEDIDGSEGTVVRGGGAEYAVSDWCETTVDCRIPRWKGYPDGADDAHDRFLELVAEQLATAAPEIDFSVDSNMFFLPVAMGEDETAAANHPLVETAKQATNNMNGYTPEIAVAPGATDAWVLYHSTRIPTLVEYGPAGALSHEPLEFVEQNQILQGAKTLLDMTVRQLGVDPDGMS